MTTPATTTYPALADPAALGVMLRRPADDERLVESLRLASDRFRGHVRHPVTYVADDTIRLDGTGGAALLLPAFPVVDVSAAAVDDVPVAVRWSAHGYLTRRDGAAWPDLPGAVTVTYSHGFPADEVPGDIAEAVLDLARVLYTVERGVTSTQVGGISRAMESGGVSEQWARAVERWSVAGARC